MSERCLAQQTQSLMSGVELGLALLVVIVPCICDKVFQAQHTAAKLHFASSLHGMLNGAHHFAQMACCAE